MKKNRIICITFYLCIVFMVFLAEYYELKQTNLLLLSNQLYTSNARILPLSDLEQIMNLSKKGIKEYRIFIEHDNNIRYFKQIRGNWSPPMLDGKFFRNKEYGKKAVIGKNYVNTIIIKNQMKYISFQKEMYEVIGIMGASFSSDVDSMILLNIDEFNLSDQQFVIDSNYKNILKKLGYPSSSNSNLELTNKGLTNIEKIFPFKSLMITSSFLIAILGITVFTKYWFESNRKRRNIMYLIGSYSSKEYIKNSIEFFVHISVSSIILIALITSFVEKEKIIQDCLFIYLFALLYTLLVLGLLYIKGDRRC